LTKLSVVIPALDDAAHIHSLLASLRALDSLDLPDLARGSFEIILVGCPMDDDARRKMDGWAGHENIRFIECTSMPSLADSILAGAAAARSNVIVVMDRSLACPPEQLPAIAGPVLNGNYDVAVGSCCAAGSRIEGRPRHLRWLSPVSTWLTNLIDDAGDAASGFLAFRRELASTVAEHAQGHRILFASRMVGQGKLKVAEVPVCFSDPVPAASFSHPWNDLQRLVTLAGGSAALGAGSRFPMTAWLGVIIDAVLFQLLMSAGVGLALAHMASFFTAATLNHALHAKHQSLRYSGPSGPPRPFGRLLMVGVLAVLTRGGILALLVYDWQLSPFLAIFPAIAMSTAISYLGSIFYVSPAELNPLSPEVRWRLASLGIVAFIVLLRLIYLGAGQLIPDEAYYWNYAQHMDWSFYDHPPMVAWLIWLGTAVFGNTEFGVRIGAFLSGLVTMGYLYALARNLYDKSTAIRTVLLLAILPFSFATGLLMTADAPLIAAWAATLYYMERALIAGRSSAWVGMGIAFGLGILSKYTLALLGLAALLFAILDPKARRWLGRPHPYLAAGLALLLFTPVIIWNMEHQWASITFQSSRMKGVGDDQFSTHLLFVNLLLLLTPVGLLAAASALLSEAGNDGSESARRRRLFVRIFTGAPLAVFFVLSMFDSLRFHWTAPLWLAILPSIAWMMKSSTSGPGNMASRLLPAWKPTIAICVLAYAFALHYAVLGIPGIPYPVFMRQHYFWHEATGEVEKIVEEVHRRSGQKPLVVGMSKWPIASSLTFYDRDDRMDIRSRNMFGDSGAMYQFWYPSEPPVTRPIILIGNKKVDLECDRWGNDIAQMLDQPGPVLSHLILREDKPLRWIYYRVAKGYRGIIHRSC
jgi:dolichol-phosphate mannosyltransferase